MQAGGGPQQGPGHGRRTAASESVAPSSSSSAALERQHQHQQQQQWQLLSQQLLRRGETNDAFLTYQAANTGQANFTGASGSMQLPQKLTRLDDLGQHHVSPGAPDQNNNRSQDAEPQMLNPIQQAYFQYDLQASQQKADLEVQSHPQMRPGMFSPLGKDQDLRMGNIKMQELIYAQSANRSQASSSKKLSEQAASGEKQHEHSQRPVSDNIREPNLGHSSQPGQAMPSMSMIEPQLQQNVMNSSINPTSMAEQMQAMQALALERNIDLSHPANASMISQLIPFVQSRMVSQQKTSGNSMGAQQSASFANQLGSSRQVGNESSPRDNSSSDVSGPSGSARARQINSPSTFGLASSAALVINSGKTPVQHFPMRSRKSDLNPPQPTLLGSVPEFSLAQNAQLNQSPGQSMAPHNDRDGGNPLTSQGGSQLQPRKSNIGFTKQQMHVLRAQILVFRRLKKSEKNLPHEVLMPRELLQSITPPPLDVQLQQVFPPPARDRSAGENADNHMQQSNENGVEVLIPVDGTKNLKEGGSGNDKEGTSTSMQRPFNTAMEPRFVIPLEKVQQQNIGSYRKSELESEPGNQKTMRGDVASESGKSVATQSGVSGAMQAKKPAHPSNTSHPKDARSSRKYKGPLFDFPAFTRKLDTLGSSMMNGNSNLIMAYGIMDLFADENGQFCKRRRGEKIKKIDKILAINLDRKRIRPDLVLRLQIESKKLQLVERQARLRGEIEQYQIDIMNMQDRLYRRFVRLCNHQRRDLNRQSQVYQKAALGKKLKSIFLWRKKLLESHWTIRDARTTRNRGIHKYHERMMRELSKKKDEDRGKRMEALKNNDVERYREMLLEQQNNIPGEAAERYAVLSSFLTKTEEYLHKLGGKITAAKNQQKVEEAANAAAAAARAQGLSEEEVRAAAARAREEVMIRNRFSEMNAPRDSSSVNKYYNLAHAVNERVIRQPSMLRAGNLRDYQLVGLQWMLSLYNNKLNGILADEMGLGKTVQVMALIAYLMELKGNYGPHLIIVPNAVLVNWKSELHSWLPTVSCIYYVGSKYQRSRLFSQEVLSLKFNVLVTTYEFIMYDRSKLSKIDWKYIIIDEAQRMKDRESVLARDLDRYRCQRRLLLTGTPLQNDLKELWSLLNLLLPEVFDNRKAFHDWFSQPFQRDGPTLNAEDDWLETEKKVIVIHRLHQILEPFMLRRRVEDVEGSLPPKVSIILKCRMSAMQSAIYDWIKATGTLRVDPEEENHTAQRNRNYQPKAYKPLNNRCVELRKVCNHPLLNYPFFSDFSEDFIVRSCGKLWILDRILIKLQRTGHRVLLFSTMTKLLDIMEDYLQWRKLVFRRIDGTTSLEDRESAIVDFNHPETDCFIFLLSIRAAGRGLNLQTADTVIIYDPDSNPKNEEQAVARAHRIGQTREVKVIYMEAVVDKIPSHQEEDEFISGGAVDSDDDLAGKDRYMGSIESLIRNNIQQYKIDMADEVINAGRFDQRTTHEERRLTLETLLHDEERYQETLHDVPSLHEVNRMIARSEEEVELFDQMDKEYEWEEMTRFDQVPDWIRASTKDVNAAVANLSKKPSNKALFGGDVGLALGEGANETEKKRGRPKKKVPVYSELDDEKEDSEAANSEDGNAGSGREDGEAEDEEGEVREFQDDELTGEPEVDKEQSEEDLPASDDGYDEYQRAPRSSRKNNNMPKEAISSGSSSRSRRLTRMASPSVSSQKFGSLSALDSRSKKRSKKSSDELEEGEIGDSQMDRHQQSGSWIQDHDEGEDEQVLQPTIKRKRSTRPRSQNTAENKASPDKSDVGEKVFVRRGKASQLKPFKVDRKGKSKMKGDTSQRVLANSSAVQAEKKESSSIKSQRTLLTRKNSNTSDLHQPIKSGRLSYGSAFSSEAAAQQCHKMSEVVQRKCKNAINSIQRRINDEGRQIIPMLTELWKKNESSSGAEDGTLGLRSILARIDKLEYSGVTEIVSDVQHMLKYGMRHYRFTYEVRSEARKVHELLFDVMEAAFPDVDFQEAINSMSFSNPAAATPHNKCPKLPKGTDSDNSPFQKPRARVPFQKASRFGSSSQSDDAPTPLTHPGDLVVCKKKRKDREKISARPGSALSSRPLSPTGLGRKLRSPGAKESSSGQLQSRAGVSPNQGSSGGDGGVAWANPVKRTRSDAGRRRPSHL